MIHHGGNTIRAVNRQPPQRRTADLHGAGAERQRLEDIGAAADAAIDIDLGLAFQRGAISGSAAAVVTLVSR